MKKRIGTQQRRHQDYLRKKTLKLATSYESKLARLRASNVAEMLKECRDFPVGQWEDLLNVRLQEPYLQDWYKGLYIATGMPQIKSTVRDMNRAKAEDSGIWEHTIARYAEQRAGEAIVIVTGTLRDDLIRIVRKKMQDEGIEGVEKLTKSIYKDFKDLLKWQVRRIAQTESLISAGWAGNMAAKSLDIGFTKQWCTSGMINTRDTHLAVDGTVVDEDEAFRVGESYLMYPHDTSMGAAAEEIINCACSCIRSPK